MKKSNSLLTGKGTMYGSQSQVHWMAVRNRLIGFSLLISAGIVLFLIFFYQSFSQSLEEEKQVQTRNMSAVAIGIIEHFYRLAEGHQLEPALARRYAMDALRSATFGATGYFWINGGDGVLLMQPYTPERVGINQIDWTDIEGQPIFREFIRKAKAGGGWVTYYWPKPKSGTDFPKISYVSYFAPWDWVIGTGIYLDDMKANISSVIGKASGFLFAVFLLFVTTAILLVNSFIRKLCELAVRDGLTELYTKRFLIEIIPSLIGKRRRFSDRLLAAIFFDIDHFKQINDTYGHAMGDQVLKKFASLLLANTRPDDHCIRYGGEEFLVIGFFDDQESARKTAERIRIEAAQMVFSTKLRDFQVTLSAGIAFHDPSESDFEQTLKLADQNLYASKNAGRNCVTV